MTLHIFFEIIGYLGSAFVLLSFLMASVAKLRIINSIGSLISVIYGILIHAYPTVVMNGCLFLINCFYLIRMFNHKEVFKVVKSDISDISYKYFFDNNKADILSFFPDIEKNMTNSNYARISFSGNEIVGVFLGNLQNGILDIYIDYTTKGYRDFSVGQALFDDIAKDSSVKQLIFKQKSTNHAKYLLSMGFKKEGDTFSKENKLR